MQFALQPSLRDVYSELLSSRGKELFFGAAAAYAPEHTKVISFGALAARAREVGEVAIGVHREGEERPLLNPPRDLELRLRPGDRLVLLGDSF